MSEGQNLDLANVDKVIHSPVRLAVVAALHSGGEESFSNLKKAAGTTDGNLTIHMKVLEENGMVSVRKRFVRRRPLTTYRLTRKGRQAFRDYVACMARMVEEHSGLPGSASGP